MTKCCTKFVFFYKMKSHRVNAPCKKEFIFICRSQWIKVSWTHTMHILSFFTYYVIILFRCLFWNVIIYFSSESRLTWNFYSFLRPRLTQTVTLEFCSHNQLHMNGFFLNFTICCSLLHCPVHHTSKWKMIYIWSDYECSKSDYKIQCGDYWRFIITIFFKIWFEML